MAATTVPWAVPALAYALVAVDCATLIAVTMVPNKVMPAVVMMGCKCCY